MAKFTVVGYVTISVHTEVEAESGDAAIEVAHGRSLMGLCFQCARSDGCDEEWRTSGELDGEPQDLTAELNE